MPPPATGQQSHLAVNSMDRHPLTTREDCKDCAPAQHAQPSKDRAAVPHNLWPVRGRRLAYQSVSWGGPLLSTHKRLRRLGHPLLATPPPVGVQLIVGLQAAGAGGLWATHSGQEDSLYPQQYNTFSVAKLAAGMHAA